MGISQYVFNSLKSDYTAKAIDNDVILSNSNKFGKILPIFEMR